VTVLVSLATAPATRDQPNDDFVAATTDAAVLLDGVGTPAGSHSGCVHGVAWFVRRLGTALLARLAGDDHTDLAACLADAIVHVRGLHERTCDLSHAGTPSATVVAVKQTATTLDYLVLSDSVLAVDRDGEVQVVTDAREAEIGRELRRHMDSLAGGTADHVAAHREYVEGLRAFRNRPGGFWVAGSEPEAAAEAVTGSVSRSDVRAVALLSDGASRLADRFELATWTEVFKTLDAYGPEALLRQVREAEDGDPAGAKWPRGKLHDDATIAYCTRIDGY
jgi:Protein phosphatase 2C